MLSEFIQVGTECQNHNLWGREDNKLQGKQCKEAKLVSAMIMRQFATN